MEQQTWRYKESCESWIIGSRWSTRSSEVQA